MIYLSQLQRLTPRKIQRNAGRCRVSGVKAYIEKDEHGKHKYVTAVVRSAGSPNQRRVAFRIYGKMRWDGAMKPQNKTWVHCSCPYFRYYVEVALSARRASNVLISNGQFPKIRNPNMKPYLCKHLFAAAPLILRARAKMRRADKIEEQELEQMVKLLEPFLPSKA